MCATNEKSISQDVNDLTHMMNITESLLIMNSVIRATFAKNTIGCNGRPICFDWMKITVKCQYKVLLSCYNPHPIGKNMVTNKYDDKYKVR